MARGQKRHLQLIAHDIRSRENVGALFRTCEFLGVDKLWLTGYTPAPPDPKLLKVSLGAEKLISWEKVVDIQMVLTKLKETGYRIVGLELDQRAIDLAKYRSSYKTALLLGNEVLGIAPSLRTECQDIIAIVRQGHKESLNVAVAAGIACWSLLQI